MTDIRLWELPGASIGESLQYDIAGHPWLALQCKEIASPHRKYCVVYQMMTHADGTKYLKERLRVDEIYAPPELVKRNDGSLIVKGKTQNGKHLVIADVPTWEAPPVGALTGGTSHHE